MQIKPVVTVINNEPTFRWTIARLLEGAGYSVITHERNTAAVDTVRELRPTAVVLEASSGSAVTTTWIVERLRTHPETRYVPIVVCSPDGRFLQSYGEYLRGQGCVVLGRPYSDEQLVDLLDRVVKIQTPLPQSAMSEVSVAG